MSNPSRQHKKRSQHTSITSRIGTAWDDTVDLVTRGEKSFSSGAGRIIEAPFDGIITSAEHIGAFLLVAGGLLLYFNWGSAKSVSADVYSGVKRVAADSYSFAKDAAPIAGAALLL